MKKCCAFLIFLSLLLCGTANSQVGQDFDIDVSIDKGDDATYYDGESIFISFRSEEDAYVVVYDVDTDGEINLVFPSEGDEDIFIKANKTYQIPEDDDFSFKVKGPEGKEYLCMVASKKPLNLPDILGKEGESYSIKGDMKKAIKKINEEILGEVSGEYSIDICHFYVEENEDYIPTLRLPHRKLPGCVEIVSRPGGAKIYLDGRYFGRTPAVIGGIPPGKHEVKLTRKGYYRIKKEFFIDYGERRNIKVNMKWKLW